MGTLESLKLGGNALTGSIPSEISEIVHSETFTNFDVVGNQLSNLPSIDGSAICKNDDELIGEHYCDCSDDCEFHEERCLCDEAQTCCTSYFSQFTPCFICDIDDLINPDFLLVDHGVTCYEGVEAISQ